MLDLEKERKERIWRREDNEAIRRISEALKIEKKTAFL